VTRAGLGAGEQIVAEEAETSEAIHAVAHPGRTRADEADATETAVAEGAEAPVEAVATAAEAAGEEASA